MLSLNHVLRRVQYGPPAFLRARIKFQTQSLIQSNTEAHFVIYIPNSRDAIIPCVIDRLSVPTSAHGAPRPCAAKGVHISS